MAALALCNHDDMRARSSSHKDWQFRDATTPSGDELLQTILKYELISLWRAHAVLFVLTQNSRLPKSGSRAWKPDHLVGTLEPRSSLMLVSTMCRIRCDWVHGKMKPEEHSPHQQSSFEVCVCVWVCVCVCVREIDVEAPADFWPLTTLCWRFYPEAKCKSLQHCRERTWSLKGYKWVCICCWVCIMMWANNNTKKLICWLLNGPSDGCNYVISCMSSFVI